MNSENYLEPNLGLTEEEQIEFERKIISDEFYVLTKTKSSADFLMQIWKRARKWGGIPTAVSVQSAGTLRFSPERKN